MYLFRYFYHKNVRAQNFIVIVNCKSSLQIHENFATKVELCDREIWVKEKRFTIVPYLTLDFICKMIHYLKVFTI